MRPRALDWLCCPTCRGALDLGEPSKVQSGDDIETGVLVCTGCHGRYDIEHGIPFLVRPELRGALDTAIDQRSRDPDGDTSVHFGYGWTRAQTTPREVSKWHREQVEEATSRRVVHGSLGIEVGSGDGRDTERLCRDNPEVDLISLDLSPGVLMTRKRTASMRNAHVVRGSALDLPVRPDLCSFAYSYGVLHHTPDPFRGFQEIVRVLRRGGRLSVYLYEAHEESMLKYHALRLVSAARRVTTRLPPGVLLAGCKMAGPVVYSTFVGPVLLAERVLGRPLHSRVPFRLGKGPFELWGDLYDRFGARIEARFRRSELEDWLRPVCEPGYEIVHPVDGAGWVMQGTIADRTAARGAGPLAPAVDRDQPD